MYIYPMKPEETKHLVNEADVSYIGKYSYADYLTWQIDEIMEIIKGKFLK